MSQVLVYLAQKEDPNYSGIHAWPTFNNKTGAVMIWNSDYEIQYDPKREASISLLLEMLCRMAGYQTVYFGKWHWGNASKH